jgi:hypothetical protein
LDAALRFLLRFALVAAVTEGLRVRLDIEATFPERDDVIATRGDVSFTDRTKRLPTKELMPQLLQPSATNPLGRMIVVEHRLLADVHRTAGAATRRTRARRGHRHQRRLRYFHSIHAIEPTAYTVGTPNPIPAQTQNNRQPQFTGAP